MGLNYGEIYEVKELGWFGGYLKVEIRSIDNKPINGKHSIYCPYGSLDAFAKNWTKP